MNALQENNYLLVRNYISAEEAESLAQEILKAEQQQQTCFDDQAPRSPAIYNLLPLVRLLVKKIPHASELAGEDLLPTYVYARNYVHGAMLHRHRDRDACEVSLTINLKKDSNWPIWVQKPNGDEVSLELEPGDAMMYLGCVADHWRDKYTGNSHIQTFTHYVKATGPRAYAFFDRTK